MAFTESSRTRRDAAVSHVLLVADSTPADLVRAVYCQSAGTISLGDRDGNVLAYAMTPGQFLPFEIATVGAITGGTFYGWG